MPLVENASGPPHAARTTFFHAKVAVIFSGVWGRVIKTRFSPRRKSYVCSDRPTEVVIWNVALPSGIEVKGTSVGETRPTVYGGQQLTCSKCCEETHSEGRKYL